MNESKQHRNIEIKLTIKDTYIHSLILELYIKESKMVKKIKGNVNFIITTAYEVNADE